MSSSNSSPSRTIELSTTASSQPNNEKSSEIFKTNESSNTGSTAGVNFASTEYTAYTQRWLILAIFVAYSASNAMQWIQYSIIANIICKYYGISTTFVDWTSMVYMVVYIPLIFPASYFLDRKGLRVCVVIGAFGTCLGAWIKVFSVRPDLFWVSFIGQTVVAVSQLFVLSVPARLAAVWFGPAQVSSACSIGVFGNQLGIAVGFLLPPMMVKNHDDLSLIGADLKVMFFWVAGITSVLLILVIVLFRAAPPQPVSAAQAQQQELPQIPFKQSVKNLILNPAYMVLLVSYGINVGVFYAISTLLNQIILIYFPGHEEDAGRIGLVIILAGMMGSVVGGIVLDKTHRFKETTLGLYIFSFIGMIIYTLTLDCGYIIVVYVSSFLLGFFMTGYLPVGFEFAAELTYPEPEGTSAGLLNAASQVFGITFTAVYSIILHHSGDWWANVALCTALLVGIILTALIRSDLRRQAAHADKPRNSITAIVMALP